MRQVLPVILRYFLPSPQPCDTLAARGFAALAFAHARRVQFPTNAPLRPSRGGCITAP